MEWAARFRPFLHFEVLVSQTASPFAHFAEEH